MESSFQYFQRENPSKQDEGVSQPKLPQLQKHFFYVFIGQPGSGKSYMIEELILNPDCYRGKFDEVLFFAPYEIGTDLELDTDNYSQFLDIDKIYERIKEFNERQDKNTRVNMLIVIDDLITTINKEREQQRLVNLFYNRRKLINNGTISIFLSTQKYKMIPARIRTCISGA